MNNKIILKIIDNIKYKCTCEGRCESESECEYTRSVLDIIKPIVLTAIVEYDENEFLKWEIDPIYFYCASNDESWKPSFLGKTTRDFIYAMDDYLGHYCKLMGGVKNMKADKWRTIDSLRREIFDAKAKDIVKQIKEKLKKELKKGK